MNVKWTDESNTGEWMQDEWMKECKVNGWLWDGCKWVRMCVSTQVMY